LAASDETGPIPLAEARHHVANVFQLLGALGRLRLQRSDDAEARRQVSWLNEAITAQGVLQHRLLSPGGSDFCDFLMDMQPHWIRRTGGRPIAIIVEGETVVLNPQAASALATIVHELVLNALAHGFPDGRSGRVVIALQPVGIGRAALSVSDDGVGYVEGPLGKRCLGLWLIAALAGQVKGALTTTHADGVSARLEFPIS
jgi:two-component sensor histidine kinase